MKTASIDFKKIPVVHTIRVDVNREILQTSVPNGYDDVKKISNRVLSFDGRLFTYCGWNSDRNEAYFERRLNYQHVVVSNCRFASINN